MELNSIEQSRQLPIQIESLRTSNQQYIYVLRDDLLPGGSKQRAVIPMLQELKRQGIKSITYASPFAGFAQVALSQGCFEVGLDCVLFAERDPHQQGHKPHPFTALAKSYGARIILEENLEACEKHAESFSSDGVHYKIPLGFKHPLFKNYFKTAVEDVLAYAAFKLGFSPKRIWLPVGSATLASTVCEVSKKDCELLCVDVHVLKESDSRIRYLKSLPQVRYFSAKQEFAESCKHLPPVPSNLYYDSKLWSFIESHGQEGDFWWNVAR